MSLTKTLPLPQSQTASTTMRRTTSVRGVIIIVAIAIGGASGCRLTPYPSGVIECEPGEACPTGYDCLDPANTGLFTCVKQGCGNGLVNPVESVDAEGNRLPAEACDDANTNDLDLCTNTCEVRSYVVDPNADVVGFGPGGAVVEDTDIGRPTVVAADGDGVVYIASIGTNTITQLRGKDLTTFAGNGSMVSSLAAVDAPPNEIATVFASSLAADGLGNVFIADLQDNVVRRVDAVTGTASTIAGNGIRAPGVLTPVGGTQTSLELPQAVTVDGDGNIYFLERGIDEGDRNGRRDRIRRVDRVTGELTVLAAMQAVDIEEPNLGLDLPLVGSPDDLIIDDKGLLHVVSGRFNVGTIVGSTNTVENYIKVSTIPLVDNVLIVNRAEVRVFHTKTDHFVIEVNELGVAEPRLVRTDLDPNGCAPAAANQERFALSSSGDKLFYSAGLEVLEISMADERCRPLCEVPSDDDDRTQFNLPPADVAVTRAADGDDRVLVADPGNGAVWSIDPGADGGPDQKCSSAIAGKPADVLAFDELIAQIVLEFAKQTDARMGVGLTEQCRPFDGLDFQNLEFYASFPDLHRVLLSDCGNRITVLAGTGVPGFAGDGGLARDAQLSRPSGAIRGPDGAFYVADRDNNRIRRLRPAGPLEGSGEGEGEVDINLDALIIETFIGEGSVAPGAAREFPALTQPTGITMDADGGLLLSDTSGGRVVRVDVVTGEVVDVIGGSLATFDDDEHPALRTVLHEPTALVFLAFSFLEGQLPIVPPGGLLLIAERGAHRIRAAIVPPLPGFPEVFTLAGTGEAGGLDADDGRDAQFFRPRSLMLGAPKFELDDDGQPQPTGLGFYVVDAVDRIRFMTLTADLGLGGLELITTVTTVTGPTSSRDDGPRDTAFLRGPSAVVALDDQRVVVVDRLTGRLRLMDVNTLETQTVLGMPDGVDVDVVGGEVEAALALPLLSPNGVAFDQAATPPTLWVTETGANRVRRVYLHDPTRPETWTTDAGVSAIDDPVGVSIDPATSDVYVTSRAQHTVVRIDAGTLAVSTFAGQEGRRGASGDDGPPVGALLNEPEGVVVDEAGRVFIADTGNQRVRRAALTCVDGNERSEPPCEDDRAPTMLVTTVLGNGDAASGGEGDPSKDFPVFAPRGLDIDAAGNLVVSSSNVIRFVQSGRDGIVNGDDDVQTIYGKAPRLKLPDTVTRCVDAVAFMPAAAGVAPSIVAADSCVSIVKVLRPVVSEAASP